MMNECLMPPEGITRSVMTTPKGWAIEYRNEVGTVARWYGTRSQVQALAASPGVLPVGLVVTYTPDIHDFPALPHLADLMGDLDLSV